MKYELAKELKEAGFTQNFNGHGYFCSKTKSIRNTDSEYLYLPDDISIPTLSELIEACGEGFDSLDRGSQTSNWYALMDRIRSINKPVKYVGSTPEEAVARLWLALNKK